MGKYGRIWLKLTWVQIYFLMFGLIKSSSIRLTNVRCKSSSNQTHFEYCIIKALNRQTQEMSIKVNILSKPVKQCALHIKFMRRTNGYRAFLPDLKVDACAFMQKRNNVILNSLMKMWAKYSNMNHNCPYEHDLIVEKLKLDENAFDWIPFPKGDYAVFSMWTLNRLVHFQMDIYFSIPEK